MLICISTVVVIFLWRFNGRVPIFEPVLVMVVVRNIYDIWTDKWILGSTTAYRVVCA